MRSIMSARICIFILGAMLIAAMPANGQQKETANVIAIAIHGGAGALPRSEMSPEMEAQYRAGLEAALSAGYDILGRGGSSLDAVTAAVQLLEDNPLFNAGRGAVLNENGVAELDASIMDGKDRRAGAIAGVRHVRSPIALARKVMENSPHVMLVGDGAEEFALTQQLELVPNEYFRTDPRREQLQRKLNRNATAAGQRREANDLSAFGTVGAVARDRDGNLAAATSTGGMTAKRWGRVGDSPIIGAGTYADNASCAVSATGHGEFFIRSVVAYDICALVAYRKMSLAAAADEVINRKLRALGGDGGIIAVDSQGNLVLEFNSEGMFRGAQSSDGRRELAIYR